MQHKVNNAGTMTIMQDSMLHSNQNENENQRLSKKPHLKVSETNEENE